VFWSDCRSREGGPPAAAGSGAASASEDDVAAAAAVATVVAVALAVVVVAAAAAVVVVVGRGGAGGAGLLSWAGCRGTAIWLRSMVCCRGLASPLSFTGTQRRKQTCYIESFNLYIMYIYI